MKVINAMPGEEITIKIEAGESPGLAPSTKEKEKKKQKRNYEKEIAWGKRKYMRFTFAVDRSKGEKFAEALSREKKTPLEWFKEEMEKIAREEGEKKWEE